MNKYGTLQKGSGNFRNQVIGYFQTKTGVNRDEAAAAFRKLTPKQITTLKNRFKQDVRVVMRQPRFGTTDYENLMLLQRGRGGVRRASSVSGVVSTTPRIPYTPPFSVKRTSTGNLDVRNNNNEPFSPISPTSPIRPRKRIQTTSIKDATSNQPPTDTRQAATSNTSQSNPRVFRARPRARFKRVDYKQTVPPYNKQYTYTSNTSQSNTNQSNPNSRLKDMLQETVYSLNNPKYRSTLPIKEQMRMLRFLQTKPEYANLATKKIRSIKTKQAIAGGLIGGSLAAYGLLAHRYLSNQNNP